MNQKTFRAEWLVLSMVGMAALATFFAPELSGVLLYDRQRIAAGEVWRLLTGHLVHFSAGHLRWNLLALGLMAILLPMKSIRLLTATGIAALTISVGLYFGDTTMDYYGGLSGLVTALIAFALLNLARLDRHRRSLAITGLSLLALKLMWEGTTANSLFVNLSESDIRPSLLAHVVGYVTGLILGYALKPLPMDTNESAASISAKQIA